MKKFSSEFLIGELASISNFASEYFGGFVQIDVVHDKVKAAERSEKSSQELFKELAEENELIRYLIDEFGAELNY